MIVWLRRVMDEWRLIGPLARWQVGRAVRREETPAQRWRRQRCAHLARAHRHLA